MPNTKDLTEEIPHRIMAIGSIGCGKTTIGLTLPGRKFAYFFDPSGRSAYRGHDVTYEEYVPHKLNVTVRRIAKKGEGIVDSQPSQDSRLKAFAYAKWEEHFMQSLDDGFFDQYDVIIFDSITTFADIAMDDILGRAGKTNYPPELADYNVLKLQISRTLRVLCALNKTLLVTAHTMYRKSETTLNLLNEILITGDLQVRAPLLFSTVVLCDYTVEASGKKKFVVQSVRDKKNENLKTDMKGLTPFHDVTISDWSSDSVLEKQGLGKLINADKRTALKRDEGILLSDIPKEELDKMQKDGVDAVNKIIGKTGE